MAPAARLQSPDSELPSRPGPLPPAPLLTMSCTRAFTQPLSARRPAPKRGPTALSICAALCLLGTAFAACAEVRAPAAPVNTGSVGPAAGETAVVTLAMYQPGALADGAVVALAAGDGTWARAAGGSESSRSASTPTGPAKPRDGSSIPTPIDHPWALGLLAILLARIGWMDWRQRRARN